MQCATERDLPAMNTPLVYLGSYSIGNPMGCKASRFGSFHFIGSIIHKCFVEVLQHQPACVRQFVVSFVWCLCDLAPTLAGAVFFRNPTLPPLWGDGFRCDLGIGWDHCSLHGLDSLCRCYMSRIAFMIIPHRRALEKQGSCPVFML